MPFGYSPAPEQENIMKGASAVTRVHMPVISWHALFVGQHCWGEKDTKTGQPSPVRSSQSWGRGRQQVATDNPARACRSNHGLNEIRMALALSGSQSRHLNEAQKVSTSGQRELCAKGCACARMCACVCPLGTSFPGTLHHKLFIIMVPF